MSQRPAYLSKASLAAALDMAESTVDEMMRHGVLPGPVDAYAKKPVWAWAAVERSLQSLPRVGDGRSVYVIGFANYVKIGFTTGPVELRIASIQTGCPERLTILAVFDGSAKDEARLHKLFFQYRSHGEWFRREGALGDWIASGCILEKVL